MKLSEIAEILGAPVADLSTKSIKQAVVNGSITSKQGEHLLAELKKADGIWKMPVRGIRRADQLW